MEKARTQRHRRWKKQDKGDSDGGFSEAAMEGTIV
jgi:hypothetical protein